MPIPNDKIANRIEAIRTATEAIRAAQTQQNEAVALAHADGVAWPQIAEALGVSRQAAHERFAPGVQAGEANGTDAPGVLADDAPGTRYVAFTRHGPHDLGGAEVTHACPPQCPAVKHFWPAFMRPATPNELAKMRRCKRCG